MKAISECGFEHPSEGNFLFFACNSLVQSQCIPKALMRGDILCQARSGMGKTCVFVISVLQNIKHSDHVGSSTSCSLSDYLHCFQPHPRDGHPDHP